MIQSIIAIYPGRFQPFGKHHKQAFEWLQKKFQPSNCFIATTDKTDPNTSPFNFNEKREIISMYGLEDRLVQVKNPYNAEEILNKYDPAKTVVVYLVGEKDMSVDPRFRIGIKKDGQPTYFQKFDENINSLQGFDKQGYLVVAPHQSVKLDNSSEMSGTSLRTALGADIPRSNKIQLFKNVFGIFNQKTADMVFNKLERKMSENKTKKKSTSPTFSKDWWGDLIQEISTSSEKELYIESFIEFAGKHLKIKTLPNIQYIDSMNYAKDQSSFGSFAPANNTITVVTGTRSLPDVLRTIAHELVHCRQHELGLLKKDSGETGSDHENQANSIAGILLREFSKKDSGIFLEGYMSAKQLAKHQKKISDLSSYLKSNIGKEFVYDFKKFPKTVYGVKIQEGGNVFKNSNPTDSIRKEDIEPTLKFFAENLSSIFPKKTSTFIKFETLGSVGKKELSGDIDLAYDIKNLFTSDGKPDLEGWGLSSRDYDSLFLQIKKRAKTASDDKISLRAMIELIGDKINEKPESKIETDTKGSGSGTLFCSLPQINSEGRELPKNVQIDINIGNLDWLKFSYYSNVYKGNVKGLHRTQLIVALFNSLGYTFLHGVGIKNKNTGKIVADNPSAAIELLNAKLHVNTLDRNVLEDYFLLNAYLKKNLNTQKYHQILNTYLKILDSTRADIPEDLQAYWKENQTRLGLTGKFLPSDSNLAKQSLNESGSAGGNRITRDKVQTTKDDYVKRVLSKFPEFVDAKISGSFNTSTKKDFGDLDLIVNLKGDDKPAIKKKLVQFLSQFPDSIIVPFKNEKYKGKKSLNTGEIVTVLYPIADEKDQFVQIDNIIALTEEEANFKKTFLDFPADVQGLILGLTKVILLEVPQEKLFKTLGIKNIPELEDTQEYEFNLSSSELSLRIVSLDQDFRETGRSKVWGTTNWNIAKKLYTGFNIEGTFDDLLKDIKTKCNNDRSKKRIKGIFKSMVSIKSGEVGTEKAKGKQRALDAVDKNL
jgi:hypothetical protein